jgi:methyl-accepting chemotaxis protein
LQLQSRITLIALVALVCIGLGSIVAGLISRGAVEDRFEEAMASGKQNLIRQIVQSQANMMRSATTSLTRNRAALSAIDTGNAELVGEEVRPAFNRLSAGEVVDRIRIVGKTGEILYSEPVLKGNQPYDNPVLAEASDARENTTGIVIDDDSALMVTFAFPLYQRGSYIGTALYARDLSKVVDEFVAIYHGSAVLMNNTGQIVHTTDEDRFAELNISPEIFSDANVETISHGDSALVVASIPIVGANGETIGQLISVNDYTESLSLQRRYDVGSIILLFTVVIVIALSLNIYLRRAFAPLTKMTNVTGQLAGGDMEIEIPGGERADEIGEMARSLEQIRSVGIRAAQAQSSLDDASSPMMIVDTDGRVIFPNKAMIRLFETLTADLAGELDGFSNNMLTGTVFDSLHNVDAMGLNHLITLDEPAAARMVSGGHTIDLTASPVFNDIGGRLGTVVEWQDMTGQVAVEQEIAGIVHAAGEGDFTRRLREADKDGFMADLARGMNELLDVVDSGLDQVVKVVSALAEGDLTKRMQGNHKGAFLQLSDDVDRMGEQMVEIVGRIANVSGAVQTATDEISTGFTDLSARTEHQASSLEETTASMEELSATVRQNADNAQEANQVATAAREVATSGGAIVERTVAAMGSIEASSKQITDIVGLIQEIAFQTNLLALNASVEAARAGEAGRGFAVVANEVRALAQRAAAASKDIKELIVNSDNEVQEGVKLVGEAGGALEEIVNSVKKVADFVSEIAAASREQTSGIEQVSNAITSMDEMTQQNAALVQETTTTIQSTVDQVNELQQAVGFFRTAQHMSAEPREANVNDRPTTNPVYEQQKVLARKMALGGATAIHPEDDDWKEF